MSPLHKLEDEEAPGPFLEIQCQPPPSLRAYAVQWLDEILAVDVTAPQL